MRPTLHKDYLLTYLRIVSYRSRIVGEFEDTKCVPISWSARQRTAFWRRYWFSDDLMISVQRRSSGLNFLRWGPRHTVRAL